MIIYQGPSLIDGSPIVAIATAGSTNSKTGPMIQTWIIRADMDPITASKLAKDDAICGTCPHRRSMGGGCYVTLHQAPLAVYRAFQRGIYSNSEPVLRAMDKGASVRIGSYGDPMAVPASAWRSFLAYSNGEHTGYTHRWDDNRADSNNYRDLCMASVDSTDEAIRASANGWRFFLVVTSPEIAKEAKIPVFECLSDAKGKTCHDCQACDGSRMNRMVQPASPYIVAHGALVSRTKRMLPVLRAA